MYQVIETKKNKAGEVISSKPVGKITNKDRAEKFAIRCSFAASGPLYYEAVPVK
jgi:hypothetical protein